MTADVDRVRLELQRAQHAQTAPLMMAVANATSIGLLGALEWIRHPGPPVAAWVLIHIALWVPYVVREAWVRRQPQVDLASWSRWWQVSYALSAVMWGIETFTFFDVGDPLWTALRLVFFAGMGVVSVVAFANDFSFLRMAALTAIPQAVLMFLTRDLLHFVMGSGLLIYMSLCIVLTLRLNRMLTRAVELRFESEDFAQTLKVEKDRVEDAYRSKARFLAAASHDLRQPLHALSLFVELLAARVTDPTQRAFVDRIDLSSRALGGLLNALLDLSRVDAGALKPNLTHFPLSDLLHELEGEVAGAAARKNLALQFKPTTLVVESDRELLGRVLRNLLANALRYTPAGTVTVEARLEGSTVLLSVADTGLGIPLDVQEKVFEEFFQVGNPERDREQGLGLGLSIVRGICRTLEYRLTLISEPVRERGTELRVEVPLGDVTKVVEPVLLKPAADPGFQGRCVLVLDDEKDVRDGMRALLESWNCTPLCAGSFAEASVLLSTSRVPDAVICDYRLPDNMNGVRAIEQLEQQVGRRLPTLLVTGDTAAGRIRELKQSGHPVLFKPALPGKLRAALSALLNPR